MPQTVLLTGGTGTIGHYLTQLLLKQGFQVSLLSRTAQTISNVKTYIWDVKKGQLDAQAIATADHIIHLAGAGIADERWSDDRKREIIDSRTKSADLIAQTLKTTQHQVKSFISSSAIGYYGGDTKDRPMVESSPAGSDFLAQVTRQWERSADQIAELGIRTVKIRTGVVLAMEGGALPKLVQPLKLGVGAPIGTGQQYISWIHIHDICRIYLNAMTDERWQGAYNGVAPGPVTNETLTRAIAEVIHRPILLPRIPAFTIKLLFGELAVTVLGSSMVLNKRIKDETSFSYDFPNLKKALVNLLD